MTKVILMSIKPKPLKDILDGKKTKELRKSIPKDFKGWVYLYCRNSKVVARFWYNEYTKYSLEEFQGYLSVKTIPHKVGKYETYPIPQDVLKNLCLTEQEIEDYGNGKDLYAWNIRNLEIFDKPMELGDFHTRATFEDNDFGLSEKNSGNLGFSYWKRITKAPKYWQYAWE